MTAPIGDEASVPSRAIGPQLCLAALLERLAHFVVISLLALHLNERRGYSESAALSICGTFGAAVYVSAILGGWLLDRLNHPRRTTQLGAVLLCLGYVVLSLRAIPILFPLALLTAGHALYKPSLAVLFGRMRSQSAESRFRLLYLTVNMGATLAPFAAQLALTRVGPQSPFALATLLSVGTLAAVVTLPTCLDAASEDAAQTLRPSPAPTQAPTFKTVLILCLLTLSFFVGLQQTEGALIFWARDRTERILFGAEVPTLWLTSLPALCLLIVAAPLEALWGILGRRGIAVSAQNKLRVGLLVTAVAFAVFALTARAQEANGKLLMRHLVLLNLLLAVGELCVAPVAMAIVHSISPGRRQGLGMGLWFLVVAVANWLAAQLGSLSTDPRNGHAWWVWALLSGGLFVAWVVSVAWWDNLGEKPTSSS